MCCLLDWMERAPQFSFSISRLIQPPFIASICIFFPFVSSSLFFYLPLFNLKLNKTNDIKGGGACILLLRVLIASACFQPTVETCKLLAILLLALLRPCRVRNMKTTSFFFFCTAQRQRRVSGTGATSQIDCQ